MAWTLVGRVVALQYQPERVKTRVRGRRRYQADRIRSTDALLLTPDGLWGCEDGEWRLDTHHRLHPERRRWNPTRTLSFGLTSHYERLKARYGPVDLGVAGEHLIVQTSRHLDPAAVAGGVRLVCEEGTVDLAGARPLEPCVPFVRFLSGGVDPIDLVTELAFLDHGTRGFATGTRKLAAPVVLRGGEELWVRRSPLRHTGNTVRRTLRPLSRFDTVRSVVTRRAR